MSSRCTIQRTFGTRRTLTLVSRRAPSLVVASVVVPDVSKFTLVDHVGSSGFAQRVPLVMMSTGISRDRRTRKLSLNTSMCLAGPFSSMILRSIIGELVTGGGRLGSCCCSPRDTCRRSNNRLVRRRSGRFVSSIATVVGRGLTRSALHPRLVTSGLNVGAHTLCHHFGGVSPLAPDSFVGSCHVVRTTQLLIAAGLDIRRVVCRIKVSGGSCFCHRFSTGCKIAPKRCQQVR